MRILPFFSSPGYFRKMWLLDGGFSAIFSIPCDANPDKIIKITPVSRISADVKPNPYSSQTFQVIDAFRMPSLEQIYQQFEYGYNDAIRCRPKLIAKGLKLKSKSMGGGCHNKLSEHMETLKKLHFLKIFTQEARALLEVLNLIHLGQELLLPLAMNLMPRPENVH